MENDKVYSVGKFAKLIGKSVRTVQRWDKDGLLVAKHSATGRRFYTQRSISRNNGYRSRLPAKRRLFVKLGFRDTAWISDIGSGLNYKPKNFNALLVEVENNQVGKIIIAHTDRLVRFGYEWFEEFCQRHNCEITFLLPKKSRRIY